MSLNVENLIRETLRPIPQWTNEIFCVYKAKKILSLNDSSTAKNNEITDDDYYYPLGDIILIKDYPTYISTYQKNLNQFLIKEEIIIIIAKIIIIIIIITIIIIIIIIIIIV